MKKVSNLLLSKKTLGELTSGEMSKTMGGRKSDSGNTSFTKIYSCCHAGCPTEPTVPTEPVSRE